MGTAAAVASLSAAGLAGIIWGTYTGLLQDDAALCMSRVTRNVKGSRYEWKDATSMYLDRRSFARCVQSLCQQLEGHGVDIVAGIDAAGYVLGAAIASRLNVGFLTIRKGGSLCVATDEVEYSYSKGKGKRMELREGAFAAGTRVAIVDQWVDSGGSMKAAISLVERQQGVVAACVALCIEDGPSVAKQNNAAWLRSRWPCVTLVQPGTQLQRECNSHWLSSWGKRPPSPDSTITVLDRRTGNIVGFKDKLPGKTTTGYI